MNTDKTIRNVRDQKYPDYFPEGCPPEDAFVTEQTLYRLCRGTRPGPNDFISYYEKDPERNQDDFKCYGLSVMKSKEDCLASFRQFPGIRRFKSVAKGITNEERGSWMETPSSNNPRHITWWVCKGVNPCALFQFDFMIGDKR